jgi:hypothetical protein
MRAFEEQLRRHIDALVADLTRLAHQAAFQALDRVVARDPADPGAIIRTAASPPRRRLATRRRGRDALADDIVAFVANNPASGARDIARAMGQSVYKVRRALAPLRQRGTITTGGDGRSIVYFAVVGAAPDVTAPKAGSLAAQVEEYLATHGPMRALAIAAAIGLPRSSIHRPLRQLVSPRRVVRTGTYREPYYQLARSADSEPDVNGPRAPASDA